MTCYPHSLQLQLTRIHPMRGVWAGRRGGWRGVWGRPRAQYHSLTLELGPTCPLSGIWPLVPGAACLLFPNLIAIPVFSYSWARVVPRPQHWLRQQLAGTSVSIFFIPLANAHVVRSCECYQDSKLHRKARRPKPNDWPICSHETILQGVNLSVDIVPLNLREDSFLLDRLK